MCSGTDLTLYYYYYYYYYYFQFLFNWHILQRLLQVRPGPCMPCKEEPLSIAGVRFLYRPAALK